MYDVFPREEYAHWGSKCGQYASVFYLKMKPTLDMNNYVETGISFPRNLSKVSDMYCSCVMRVLVSDACWTHGHT